MAKTVMLRVYDKQRNIERTVTHKAYAAMGPKVYQKLGIADEEAPTTVESPTVQQVHRSVSAPVVKTQIPAEPEEETAEEEVVAPKKRGPKPGSKKSISSNSTEDEK
jgi:hypothetical protein